MSFPFYSRSSSKSTRTKGSTEAENKHTSASFATGPFSQGDPSRAANSGHTRSSSKMRIIPFLGKRRKSLAALRSNAIAEGDGLLEDGGGEPGHYKTVSQLANETAARLARSSFGAAGSLSTGNLELPTSDVSALNFGLGSAYITPTKGRSLDARHTMIPSGGTQKSALDTLTIPQNKRSSEKPSKASFLSRVTSRPSLASRYSSADLKSTSKTRGIFKTTERLFVSSITPQRVEIIHPIPVPVPKDLGVDNDFFTSPRVAPTPPSLCFASPGSSLLESPPGPSRSTVTLPSERQSRLFIGTGSTRSPVDANSRNTNTTQAAAKHTSSPTTISSPASLSPEMALRFPSRYSISARNQTDSLSADTSKSTIFNSDTATGSPAARPRGSHVRIGKEKVTISVANVLEAELGVDVGDSEDSSFYDDSYEDSRRLGNNPGLRQSNGNASINDSSDLPTLSPSSDDFGLAFKFPKIKGGHEGHFALESQSPLSALMSASSGEKDISSSDVPIGRLQAPPTDEASRKHADNNCHVPASNSLHVVNHVQTGSLQHSKSSYLRSLTAQSRSVDRLDRISERSVPLQQDSPRNEKDKENKAAGASSSESSPEITAQLQHSLDVQCARFDRLAGHLLQIIQRHQNEKVQLESQIAALQKEARRNEREIKALRKLIARTNRSSQERRDSHRLVRVASMQSFLSNISVKDEEVDMFVAMEMLARAGRRNSLLSPDISRDGRASVGLSPGLTPTKVPKKMDLRRSKTMPDLHKSATAIPTPMPSPPTQETSPDISGIGLGLDFPLPEPLRLPSIASTIMSSALGSNASIPTLTTAPTAASGLSLATKRSADSFAALIAAPSGPKSAWIGQHSEQGIGRGAARSAREKRMAGEWRPQGMQGLYRPVQQLPQPSAPPSCEVPALPASASYANNLNKVLLASPIGQVMKTESPDLDAMFQKLVASSSGLLG